MKRYTADVDLFAGKRTREYYWVVGDLSEQIFPFADWAANWFAGLFGHARSCFF